MPPRTSSKPTPGSAVEAMSDVEQAQLLIELLARHPSMGEEAEGLARARLGTVDPEEVAGEVAWAFDDLVFEDIGGRAGYQPGRGYVHPTEAA